MFFNRIAKPISLRFYTNHAIAYDLFRPDIAGKFAPNWMAGSDSKVKHCYGLKSLFSNGFAIPLWSDFSMQIREMANGEFEGSYNFADRSGLSHIQLENSSSPMHPKNKMLFKLLSVWFCECDEDVQFAAIENMWSNPSRKAEFVSGSLDFKFQAATNMFFYIEKKNDTINMNAGDIFILFRQLSERKLKIECQYDPEKFSYLSSKTNQTPFFKQSYMKARNMSLYGNNKN